MARFDDAHYGVALRIARRLQERGFTAYFAGGCVRDLLLGVAPKDFDVATSATPDEVQRTFAHTEAVGAHFGVVLVVDVVDGERIATEVATFRHDGAYSDGRRPDAVRFSGDPREDVLRRDFTINGLLLDALAYEAGDRLDDCVRDFVDGRRDLENRVVRAIGEPAVRFAEDKLRMLRAVRFAARLGFAIELRTMAAIRAQAAAITQVSAERVREELTRILTEGSARRGFELLDETGLLQQVLPEVARMKGVEQPPQYHPEGDVWVHTLMLLEHLRIPLAPTNVPQRLKPHIYAHNYGTAEAVPLQRPQPAHPQRSEAYGTAEAVPLQRPQPAQPQRSEDHGSAEAVPLQRPQPAHPQRSEAYVAAEAVPLQRREIPKAPTATLAWGMLLHDIGKPATYTAPDPAKPGDRIRFNGHVEVGMGIARVILNRLRFSNDDCAQILALIQHHMQFGDVMKMKQSTLKRFLRLPKFDEHLALHYADVMSSNRHLELYEFAKKHYEESPQEVVRPALLVTGRELIAAGYRPGPQFKAMLIAAEDAQLEGRVQTAEEALALLFETFGAPAS